MEEDDQERRRKLEAGKAKLAQFRQRKGQSDGPAPTKRTKKKKTSSGSKHQEQSEDAPEAPLSQSDDAPSQSGPSTAGPTAEFTIMRTLPHGETIKHDKTYTIEPESEVSTTAEDYSSEEEEFKVRETFSERDAQSALTRLEVMEDELVGKQQEIEELNRELEEMRAAYGTEGLQQLQEFETAIKQRDGIITQLTSNLQQARKEKDDIMREFLELTDQSQKLKIQFQHLQAGETLRNTSHSSTAADLLHSKQQIITYQQQLEERDHQLTLRQKEIEEFKAQVMALQEQISSAQQQKELELSYEQKLNEKDLLLESLKSALRDEEIKSLGLNERIGEAEKSVDELNEQLTQKSLEISSLSEELNSSRQKERRSSDEIKQLMGAVEDLQKKHYRDSQSEAELVQRMELETQRKLEQLQAELDEMHGQQLVQMKQELVRQHTLEIDRLLAEHKQEVDRVAAQSTASSDNQQIKELNAAINELNARLQQSDDQKNKMKEDFSHRLQAVSAEKSQLQKQIEDLLQDLRIAREQVHKARQSLTEKENKLNEASSLFVTIDGLKAELAAANEFTKELESKHEAEVTNYKIKLDMLEREKDAVLDRMAESQEAELEKLRTSFLFSQEEDLMKLREDLTREHRTNIENLKSNLEVQYKQQMDQVKHDLGQTITAMQSEKDGLVTKQNNLMLENSKLKDLLQSVSDPKSEQMMIQINELQKELECLRREEKEKGTIEQELQVLQLQVETLEKEVKEKDALVEKVTSLELDNRLLKDQNDALQRVMKERNLENCETLEQSISSDDLALKNEVERLASENKLLRDLEHQLKEEIERQKNTFSFAEKNFDVNYQELKEEYSCLVKLKEDLEDGKARLEEEYKAKLDALNYELEKLKRGDSEVTVVPQSSNLEKADGSDVAEVVEKDTTELMEKLEIAQRDKQELSLKLSSISEELQLKQNEINQLKEQVKSLCLEKRYGTEEESMFRDVNVHSLENSLEESGFPAATHPSHLPPQIPSLPQGSKEASTDRESLLQRLDDLTRELEKESAILGRTRLDNEQLQQKLDAVLQEQAEMALQLEAQRVSLTQIHKAQLELMEERFQSDKKSELCVLRESLLRDQEQKILALRSQHQRELESLQQQNTASGVESCQDLTQLLMKRIHDECADINQVLLGKETEVEDQAKQERSVNLNEITSSTSFTQQRTALQTLRGNLTTLLERFVKEYKLMGEITSHIGKTADLAENSQQPDSAQDGQLVIHSQSSASEVCEGSSEEAEKLKAEFGQQRAQLEEKHAQEIQHLRSYFQQQLKENEERFSKEVIHLQEQLQHVTASSLQLGELCEPVIGGELGAQEDAIFQSAYATLADTLKQVDASAGMGDPSLRRSIGPIYHELQTLRQALFSKYVEEVGALKKQHEAELDQLRADLTEKFSAENAALRQEVLQLTSARQEALNGGFQPTLCPIPEEKGDADQLLEERYQEKIEREVARVIVEMSIAFAQQTELARLTELEKTEPQEHAQDASAAPQPDLAEMDEEIQDLQDLNLMEPSMADVTDVDLILEQGDTGLEEEPLFKEESAILKQEDSKQMVAMGAESAKFQQMYDERVEEMRQELVRQEQEYQQATEALRLAHAAQLESQMYDQEQMLAELHRLRAQLAESASATAENQASEQERILLEELEALKQTCAEVAEGKPQTRVLQDSASQTQDEPVTQLESGERAGECGQDEEERRGEESQGAADPSTERKNLKRLNKRLVRVLLEVVKTTGAAEETIGRHVVGLLDKSGRRASASKVSVWSPEQEDLQAGPTAGGAVTAGVDIGSWEKQEGVWSEAAEKDLDVPLTEADFPGTGISPEEEAQLISVSTRLQATVEKLLEAINETSNQLEHARAAQTELVRESVKRKQETTDLLRCQEELQERLSEEVKTREHLALELSKAEGLLDGYTDERVFLEKQMQEKIELIRHLEQELQNTGNRLQELEQERQQIQEEKELLARQKLALKAGAAPAEQQLLEETEKLLKEKIEVQRQAEKDSGDLTKHVKVLEVELEEQVNQYVELEQEKNAVLEDLRQKNLSLEKQLEKTRRFLDEQAVDREHERDVFQQEIQKLEQQLKMPQRHQPVNEDRNNEVEKLESHLKEKTDKCSELLLCKEQLQRDVQERNEEIEKLESRMRELEQALLISADTLQKAEDRRPSFAGVKGEMPLEAQLQVEREATDRKEKEITNLVEQLEQFREELENKNEEVQQLHMQLEIQRKESATRLQELEQENKVLKNDLEVSQHEENPSPSHTNYRQRKMEEDLLSKEQEIELLNEQIGKLQAHLDAAADNKVIEEKNEQIKEYKSQIKCLKSEQEQLKKNSEEEIEKLNEVIEKLQEELSNIEQIETVGFTSMAEVIGASQSLEMAENKYFLHSLSGQGDDNLVNTEDNLMEVRKKESLVAQGSVRDMESQLQQLLESVKEKDLNLKQYFDQIVTLKEESQALNRTIEKLKLEVALTDMDISKTELHAASEKTWAHGTDEAYLNSELQATKAELNCVKEELEKFKRTSENSLNKELAAVLSQEDIDQHYKASIESLTESLREKTAQHLAVEALLQSVQEASHNTICELQSRLLELQKSALEKESQLQELANNSQLLEQKISADANDMSKNGERQIRHKETSLENTEAKDTEVVQAKETEDAKEDRKLLNDLLNPLKETQRLSEVAKENRSREDGTRQPKPVVANTEEATELSHSFENTTANTVQNLESQLQDLQKVIQLKDSELQQYVNQKDLLDRQVQEIDRLNKEIGNLKEVLAPTGSEGMKNDRECPLGSREILENKQSPLQELDELVQTKAELAKAKMELALLTEELMEVKLNQKHDDDDKVESASTKGDFAKSALTVGTQEQTSRETSSELLVSQTMCRSLEETAQEPINKMESQVQELQRVIALKDSELLQYAQQKELFDHQTREVEQLKELVKTLKQELTDIDSHAWGSPGEDKKSSGQAVLEDGKIPPHKTALDGEKLIHANAELDKARLELAVLKEELSKASLPQKHNDISNVNFIEGEAEPKVPELEQALREKAAELLTSQTLVASLESQLQELQKIIQLKDSELLHSVQQKDLLAQQTREVERLNEVVKALRQELPDMGPDAKLIDEAGQGYSKEELLQKADLENKELMQAKAELDKAKMELAALKEELLKVSLHQKRYKGFKLIDEEGKGSAKEELLQKADLENKELMQAKAELDKAKMELAALKEELLKVSLHQKRDKGFKLIDEEGQGSANEELLQKADLENKELIQAKAELDKAKIELAALTEELLKASFHQKSDKGGLGPHEECEPALEVSELEQALRDKTAELLASQTLVSSLEETTQATMRNMQSQLQERQQVIDLKDSELLQYESLKDLLEQRTREVERLNEVVKVLQHELSDIGPKAKISHESKESSREDLLDTKSIEPQNADLKSKELMHTKAELDQTKLELATLKEELTKAYLHQKSVKGGLSPPREGEPTLEVHELEQALQHKTAELLASQTLVASLEEAMQATIKNLESQLQELQKVIDRKDSELLQYVSLKDLVDQQNEGVHFNELIQIYKRKSDEEFDVQQDERVVKPREVVLENEVLLLQNAILDGQELTTVEAELERTTTDLAVLTEELTKLRLFKEHDDTQYENPSEKNETAQSTIHNVKSQLQELQEVIRLKDSELLQYVNQKDLIDQQTKEIEHLKELIKTYKLNSEDGVSDFRKGHVGDSGNTLFENERVLLQKATVHEVELAQAKAELERTKMDLVALTEELTKLRLVQNHDNTQHRNTSDEDTHAGELEQALRIKTEELLASQTLFASLEETSQKTIYSLKEQLHELEKAVQLKDSELLQDMNQQNTVRQQAKQIEHLSSIIDSLQKQLEDEGQKILIQNSESDVDSKKSMKELMPHMNGDERMILRTVEAKAENKELEQPSHLRSTQEDIECHREMAIGDLAVGAESTDEEDWVVEALKDKTAQLLANQVLYTSTQEAMQSTIDALEAQMADVQEVIKEKDAQILLYRDEIKALKEQVKFKMDEQDQVMLAMEDSLREKVAAALVSEAQLKAIQVHTKRLPVDNTSSQTEAATVLQDSGSKPPHQEESEAKLSVLNLQVLELEKQLSDLHEQLQMERDQADLAHQLADEKERQLAELQQSLESTRAKQALNQKQGEIRDDALTQENKELFKGHTMTKLEQQLQDLTEEATATKDELCHYRELSEKLKEQLMVKESSLAHLEEDLREVKKCLCHAEEKLAFYMKREIQEEQLQNTSGIDFPDALRSPDWTTSSSQTDKVLSVNSSNQTSRVPEKHIGVQKELEAAQLRTSDEVAELMEQYTDKIGQMQELHAAEILDMESRHISETESLRREQYAVVQALTDECDALKAVIDALKSSGEGVSASYHFTDAASSDAGTECDWSQETCDVQSLDQLPEGLRGADDIQSELIPNKIKDLLRAVQQEGMQVLSLTEATSPEKEPPYKVQKQPWQQERKALLETIASLKELIAKMQIHKAAHTGSDFHGLTPDWRGELLRAIQEVFHREQDMVMSAFHTQLASMGRYDASALLNQIQHRLQEQGMEQINAMDCIQNADRRSLLLEIQDLRAQLTALHGDPEIQSLYHPSAEGGAPYVQQEQPPHSQELHMQLTSMNAQASNLQEQLGSERLLSSEIKNELALTRMELESNLKLQHKHFKELESLRTELKRKREELDSLNDALANEQRKCRELQYTLEKQQTRRERRDLQEKEQLEDLQILLEEQKSKNLQIAKQLEEEKGLVKDLQEQLVSRGSTYDSELSQERSRVLELQVLLDAEKARSTELSKAIECQQGLEAHLHSTEVDGQPGEPKPAEHMLKELKDQLDSKHTRIVELVSEAEVYKLECVQLRQSLEEERQSLQKGLEAERETSRLALKQVEELTATVKELQCQIQERAAEIRRRQAEEKRLKEAIQSLQNRTQDTREGVSERKDLTKTSTAKKSPSEPESRSLKATGVPNLLCPDPLSVVNGDLVTERASFSIDRIKQRLQQVSSKLRQLATKANQRILFEKADEEDLAWSQNSVQEVLSQLEHAVILSLQGQNLVLPAGMSINTLTEKLLTQNAELTGYVSRLTEEKNDLQNSLLRLEGEVSRYRARRPSGDYSMMDNTVNADDLLAAERDSWSREKTSLRRSLKQAEAELSKVKAELRNEVAQRDLGRDTDNMALKRVYGKYLRSESYRKALVYQKKYLLLLLGGFQECEEATLALIARMGGQPAYTDLEAITNHSRAFTRFRSAARVAIAVSRMKFLVRRWQRATISTVSVMNRNSSGQTAGNEVRSDSAYHPARGMELYGEQRISSCRSQSGFNSPQSTVNSQHRYISASDTSPCSHLQHYDPDKALTDYITRLEALQKRLGTVPSGSSANPPTHYSVRR